MIQPKYEGKISTYQFFYFDHGEIQVTLHNTGSHLDSVYVVCESEKDFHYEIMNIFNERNN